MHAVVVNVTISDFDGGRKMLEEEMESMVPPRRKQIEEAQSEIIGTAKRLIDEGRIVVLELEEEPAQEVEF